MENPSFICTDGLIFFFIKIQMLHIKKLCIRTSKWLFNKQFVCFTFSFYYEIFYKLKNKILFFSH